MRKVKVAVLLGATAMIGNAGTVVFQQGLNGYTGCEDTYWYTNEGSNGGGISTPAGNNDYMELTRASF